MEVADVEEKYASYEFEDKDDGLSLDGQPECLQWAYTGNCDRAPNGGQGSCRYKHLYTAGYKSNKAIKSTTDEEGLEASKAAARRGLEASKAAAASTCSIPVRTRSIHRGDIRC